MGQLDVNKLLGQVQTTVAASESVEAASAYAGSMVGLPRALSNPTKDPFGFVLQVGSLLFGAEFLESKLNALLRKLAGTTDNPGELETLLKGDLYRMCVSGLGERLIPANFRNPGYTIPVRLLDLFELFRVEPASDEGKVCQGPFERAIIENVLRRPGVAHRLPDLPYLVFTADATGQAVTINYDDLGGPQPGPTRLVDLFADIIYDPAFRLFDPGRVALDVLDVALGVAAKARSARGLEREHWLAQVVDTLSAETTSETLFDFSAPALAGVRAAVGRQRAGVPVDGGCEGETTRQVPAAAVVVPVVPGTKEPSLELAYQQLSTSYLVTSGSPGAAPDAPLRDSLSSGLAKALIQVLARNTVFAPQVWSLLVLGRLLRGGYSTSDLTRYLSKGVNEADFKDLVTGVRPLLESAVQVLVRAGVDYLSQQLLKKLERLLRPLLLKVAGEQAAAYTTVLDSLLPLGINSLVSQIGL